jgi:hypothetical protein
MQVTLYNGNFEFANEITYRHWTNTDPPTLTTVVVPCKEYIDDMNDKIWTSFCLHHFVAAHETAVLAKYVVCSNVS